MANSEEAKTPEVLQKQLDQLKEKKLAGLDVDPTKGKNNN